MGCFFVREIRGLAKKHFLQRQFRLKVFVKEKENFPCVFPSLLNTLFV